jgi:hypothetical protein
MIMFAPFAKRRIKNVDINTKVQIVFVQKNAKSTSEPIRFNHIVTNAINLYQLGNMPLRTLKLEDISVVINAMAFILTHTRNVVVGCPR